MSIPQKRQYDGDEYEGCTKKRKEASDELEVAHQCSPDRGPIKRKMNGTEHYWWSNNGTSVFSEDGTKQRKLNDDDRGGACQHGRTPNDIFQPKVSQSNGNRPDPNEAAVPSGSRKRKFECLERDEAGSNRDTDKVPSVSWVHGIHHDLGNVRSGASLMCGESLGFDEMFAYLTDLDRPLSM